MRKKIQHQPGFCVLTLKKDPEMLVGSKLSIVVPEDGLVWLRIATIKRLTTIVFFLMNVVSCSQSLGSAFSYTLNLLRVLVW